MKKDLCDYPFEWLTYPLDVIDNVKSPTKRVLLFIFFYFPWVAIVGVPLVFLALLPALIIDIIREIARDRRFKYRIAIKEK